MKARSRKIIHTNSQKQNQALKRSNGVVKIHLACYPKHIPKPIWREPKITKIMKLKINYTQFQQTPMLTSIIKSTLEE